MFFFFIVPPLRWQNIHNQTASVHVRNLSNIIRYKYVKDLPGAIRDVRNLNIILQESAEKSKEGVVMKKGKKR